VNDDRAEVDELMLEITDYKNDYADMAIEKLFRKCSTSWEDSLGQPNTGVMASGRPVLWKLVPH